MALVLTSFIYLCQLIKGRGLRLCLLFPLNKLVHCTSCMYQPQLYTTNYTHMMPVKALIGMLCLVKSDSEIFPLFNCCRLTPCTLYLSCTIVDSYIFTEILSTALFTMCDFLFSSIFLYDSSSIVCRGGGHCSSTRIV